MAEPNRGSLTRMPRWVKVLGIIAIVVLLAFVISLLAGVRHGPIRHAPPGGGSIQAPPAGGHTPPVQHP